ncbi:MAG: isopeptide-forming domain-containing fimbrial protein [Clostridia bacterium]|nr:isopeptide-forming domain-containing fimbrial protein [Clostridia bacterium]MBQ7004027.1 isopeptide-forming domain-containing fimbrial protein [Oscillospiraceae bacterium]MBQ9951134.1 isopeptide-forming domain-containing fimbrial protein [Clostridia bacterium]
MNMKKFVSLVLAMVMMMAMMVPAMAEETPTTPVKNNSITINDANAGETYKLYKLFDLVVDNEADPVSYSYTVNKAWVPFFSGNGVQYITVNDAGYVTEIKNAETGAAALAAAAEAYAEANNIAAVQTVKATTTTVVFENLENGYWLITSTLGTLAMTDTTPAKKKVEITEKNPENTIEKKVKEDSTNAFGDTNDAQVGDIVEFKSTAVLNPHTVNVKVHDKMDAGLTLNKDSIAIEGLTKDTDYTVAFDTDDGCDFEIIFDDDYLASLTAQTTLTITYTAVLNENAVVKDNNGVAIVDQNNKTQLTYGDGSSTVEDTTTTTTHKFTVNKYADDVQDLAGAVFSLKKNNTVVKLIKIDDNNYRVANGNEENAVDTFTTVATGDIVIWGVDADSDYTLLEIEAPAGYNKLNAEVKVTVNADNSTLIDVENKTGTELPSTGGMGTTMMYIAGGLLVAAAVVLLIAKRRANAAE